MTDKELWERLHENAEWARCNEWETPLCLADDLTAAADAIERLRNEAEGMRSNWSKSVITIKRLKSELTQEKIDNTNLIGELATVAAERDRYKAERENPQLLTLEELRGMDGEWVWVISSDPDLTVSGWAYIAASQAHTLWEYKPDRLLGNVKLDFEDYGKTWLAYRSKPKRSE